VSAPPGAPAGASAPGGRVTAKDQNNKIATVKASIKEQLLAEGANEKSAEVGANVLTGQAMAESGLKSQFHDAGRRLGRAGGYVPSIYGADKARGKAMTAWLAKNNLPDTPENQGKWMAHEAWTKYPKTRAAIETGNQDHAADVATKNYEAPQDQGPGQLRTRRGYANQAAQAQTTTAGAQPNGQSAQLPPGVGGGPGVLGLDGKPVPGSEKAQPNGQSNPVATGQGNVEEAQSRVAGVRRGKLDPQLREALEYSAEASGLKVRVTSGGQRMEGAHGHTGSHRHDKGRAADIDVIDPKTGKVLDRSDPRRLKFLEESAAAGAGGTGAGYMSDSRKIHVGTTGSKAIIGQGLGAYAGNAEERAAVARGLKRMMTPEQVAEARQKQIAANAGTSTARIDQQVAPAASSGQVQVTVNSNGTKADADTKTKGDLFQKPQVKQHRQMQKTEDAAETMSI